jgi:hypothetical protein
MTPVSALTLSEVKTMIRTGFDSVFASDKLYYEYADSRDSSGHDFVTNFKKNYYLMVPDHEVVLLDDPKVLKFSLAPEYRSSLQESLADLEKAKLTMQDTDRLSEMDHLIQELTEIVGLLDKLPIDASIDTKTDLECKIKIPEINAISEKQNLIFPNTKTKRQALEDDDLDVNYNEYVDNLHREYRDVLVPSILFKGSDFIAIETFGYKRWLELINKFFQYDPDNEEENDKYISHICEYIFSMPPLTEILAQYDKGTIADLNTSEKVEILDRTDPISIELQYISDIMLIGLGSSLTRNEIEFMVRLRRGQIQNADDYLLVVEGLKIRVHYENLTKGGKIEFVRDNPDKVLKMNYVERLCSARYGILQNEYTCPESMTKRKFLPRCIAGKNTVIRSGWDPEVDSIETGSQNNNSVTNTTIPENTSLGAESGSEYDEQTSDETGSDSVNNEEQVPQINDIAITPGVVSADNPDPNLQPDPQPAPAIINHHRNIRTPTPDCINALHGDGNLPNQCFKSFLKEMRDKFATQESVNLQNSLLGYLQLLIVFKLHLSETLENILELKTLTTSRGLEKYCQQIPLIEFIHYTSQQSVLYTKKVRASIFRPTTFCSYSYCHKLFYSTTYLVTDKDLHCKHANLINKDNYVCQTTPTINQDHCFSTYTPTDECVFRQTEQTPSVMAKILINSDTAFVSPKQNILRVNTYDTRKEIDNVMLHSQSVAKPPITLDDKTNFFISKTHIRLYFDRPDSYFMQMQNLLWAARNLRPYAYALLAVSGLFTLGFLYFLVKKMQLCIRHYKSLPTEEPGKIIRNNRKNDTKNSKNSRASNKSVGFEEIATSKV